MGYSQSILLVLFNHGIENIPLLHELWKSRVAFDSRDCQGKKVATVGEWDCPYLFELGHDHIGLDGEA